MPASVFEPRQISDAATVLIQTLGSELLDIRDLERALTDGADGGELERIAAIQVDTEIARRLLEELRRFFVDYSPDGSAPVDEGAEDSETPDARLSDFVNLAVSAADEDLPVLTADASAVAMVVASGAVTIAAIAALILATKLKSIRASRRSASKDISIEFYNIAPGLVTAIHKISDRIIKEVGFKGGDQD